MKFITWLLLAFGLLLAQVRPAPAAMRVPSGKMPCGQASHPCQDHASSDAPPACAVCYSCGLVCHFAVLTSPLLPAPVFSPAASLVSLDEFGRQWRDPPPLRPPRLAEDRRLKSFNP
jgi:hypothetical protein